ncbi:MAG: hypothetical protein H6905_00790 [Hyphomicrobiales bacterium]|nr:hypothetical protein [Hyphomicrobiales bacterium]
MYAFTGLTEEECDSIFSINPRRVNLDKFYSRERVCRICGTQFKALRQTHFDIFGCCSYKCYEQYQINQQLYLVFIDQTTGYAAVAHFYGWQ